MIGKIGGQGIAGDDQVSLRVERDAFHFVDLRTAEISAVYQRIHPRLSQVESPYYDIVVADGKLVVSRPRTGNCVPRVLPA